MHDEATQRATAEEVAAAGVAVVALPQTNLFLQGREHRVATPRGLTAVRALLAAGATLAAGADNLQDPFNLVGRGDPFETAALMVMAGHLTPEEAWATVTDGSRTALGLAPAGPCVGATADLLAVDAPSLRAAVASAPAGRTVVHHGRIVAAQRLQRGI
jgi:cytosine deaminase